ncbi:MAG: hypothetical protein Q4B67_00605 [Eubacteriales bacterium]|nr:hypothetical protein [Eubacteriales bacterium]
MNRSDYDDYRYDNNSRRTVRRSSSAASNEPARERRSSEYYDRDRNSGGPSVYYDARGVRVKKSKFANGFVKALIFFVIPYIVINSIIFILVTAAPKIDIAVKNTDNYKDTTVTFDVNCLLPVKELSVTMESEEIPYEKSGNSYTATVSKNGTIYITVTALNGMSTTNYAEIGILDDVPPVIDETKCRIENGVLTFTISDTQSGVDFDSIYGTDSAGRTVTPESINKTSGTVSIPMTTNTLEIHFSDMVGNAREASISANEVEMFSNQQ